MVGVRTERTRAQADACGNGRHKWMLAGRHKWTLAPGMYYKPPSSCHNHNLHIHGASVRKLRISLSLSHDFHCRFTSQNSAIPLCHGETLFSLQQRQPLDFAKAAAVYKLVLSTGDSFENNVSVHLSHLRKHRIYGRQHI